MKRVAKEPAYFLPGLIVLSLIVFAIDVNTPLGSGDYIFYFIPSALAIFGSSVMRPIQITIISTILSVIGFYLSPPSALNYQQALINRLIAIFTIWVIAFLAKRVLTAKLESLRQNWLKDGLANLTSGLTGELSREEIASCVLRFFRGHLNMKMGACYEKVPQAPELNFIGGQALPPNHDRSLIPLGEGIIGQCALEKRTEIVELPPDAPRITSATFEAAPRWVVLLPFVTDGELFGIIEATFLERPNELSLELMHNCTTFIAQAIRSGQYNLRLNQLLTESQQLAEELQAQQEELRVTNEELEQQSRAVRESYSKLENQQAELEQTNQQLEEQTQALERQKGLLDERNQELLEIQGNLLEKTGELEKLSRYKSEFLANMSHELRTPLNSSLILAKLLADNKHGNLSAEQVKQAQIIYSSGNDLLNLINDILDLAKVEAGKMEVNLEEVAVPEIIEQMKRLMAPVAQEKGLNFTLDLKVGTPLKIQTDRVKVEQVLKNFLSNAIKFTHAGSVDLSVFQDQGEIVFRVTDTGIGIPPEQQEIIFEAFRQADGTTNRKYGGTGLGLSISRELAQLLGGEIMVESKVGQGSSFSLRLPLIRELSEGMPKKQKSIPLPPKSPPVTFSFKDDRELIGPDSSSILIIEDDENFARILLDLAHEMDFKCLVTPTAEEGVSLAREHLPRAVILDIRLPDHSGLLVLDQLKSNSRTRHIPVHVISAEDFSGSALEMGAMGHMLKPVKSEKLREAFEGLSTLMRSKNKRVLVVEDDEVQREQIIELLSDPGVTVTAVATGAQALKNLTDSTFDCMVMDLSLPDMSGFDLLSKLAVTDSPYSYPPVIVYTARDVTREEEDRLRKYSGSIIIKGARSPERLLNEVTLFLHKVEADLPPQRQRMLHELRQRDQTLKQKVVLVVDDDVRNIFALTSALEGEGAKILIARNGKESLSVLEKHPETDLVLMDIMMPEMDGYEAMRRIRAERKNKELPIIALTAKAMRDDQEKCLAAGANDYMAKPLDMEKLVSLIRVWMRGKRSIIL